jgi:carbonic anhydrase/acetyltransferase-like protein (isoleucine patch superfamily)
MIYPYQSKYPDVAKTVFLADGVKIIGDVKIGDYSNVWYNCVVRGDVNNIIIGKNTNIQDLTMIHVATFGQGTYIGDNVTVGHSALLHACTIGNDAYVGMQSCILDGAKMSDHSMLGAGSLLTSGKTVPSGELWAGRPAKFMRTLTYADYDMIKWSYQHYVTLADNHRNVISVK